MTATAEIDKAGRIIIPKKLRDSLHLIAGTRVTFREERGEIVISAEMRPRGLYMKNGIPVYDTGPLPKAHENWVDQDREDRADELMLRGEFPARGLYMDRGSLVYDPGPAPAIDVLEWIQQDREARDRTAAADSEEE